MLAEGDASQIDLRGYLTFLRNWHLKQFRLIISESSRYGQGKLIPLAPYEMYSITGKM